MVRGKAVVVPKQQQKNDENSSRRRVFECAMFLNAIGFCVFLYIFGIRYVATNLFEIAAIFVDIYNNKNRNFHTNYVACSIHMNK